MLDLIIVDTNKDTIDQQAFYFQRAYNQTKL